MATNPRLRMIHNIIRREGNAGDTHFGMNALYRLNRTPEGYGLIEDALDAAYRLRLKHCRHVTPVDFEGEAGSIVRELTTRYREEVKLLAERAKPPAEIPS